MSDAPQSNRFYKVGGALPQEVPSYVTRASDDELYTALNAGEFCYVLNSRQMGKSSLMVRTLTRLKADGWAGVILDFSAKDSQSEQPDRWYAGIINQLNRELKLLDRPTFRQWLKERDFIDPVERLGEFIETVLLPGCDSPIVLLIDEIDSTITLPFTDDFFALIRACYNKRAENPDYQRLTLALFGVAMPSELIGDVKRTPFNIGKAIDLKGFELEEALPLAAGLAANADRPPVVLQEILRWTGGQPFLTQRLCQLAADAAVPIAEGREGLQVEELVRTQVIELWESQDYQEHLKTIRNRLVNNEKQEIQLLSTYQKILRNGAIRYDNSLEQIELRLSGLVVLQEGRLRVYNRIYGAIFNEGWIRHALENLRPYSDAMASWMASGNQDKSFLLKGIELEEALIWSENKKLSSQDYQFLTISFNQEIKILQEGIFSIDKATSIIKLRTTYLFQKLFIDLKETALETINSKNISIFSFYTNQEYRKKIFSDISVAMEKKSQNSMSEINEYLTREIEVLLKKNNVLFENRRFTGVGAESSISFLSVSTSFAGISSILLATSVTSIIGLTSIILFAAKDIALSSKALKEKLESMILREIGRVASNSNSFEEEINRKISNLSEDLKSEIQGRIELLSEIYRHNLFD